MWRLRPSSSSSLLRRASSVRCFFARHHRYLSTTAPPFEKVLIANRGEISQRVMRTCHAMGIDTVAIYSTADAQAPFVQEAREAICIGPPSSTESYLNAEKILSAIQQTGAQAVHPGYGFMSENAAFSKAVTDMGVAWLGPSPHAVQDMGDKLTSKQLAETAGVHIIPGYDGPMLNIKHAIEVANDVGYPILLKAASGGGGKGMRVCRNDADVIEAFPMATEEGLKFFKDPRLLCEKYVRTVLELRLIRRAHSNVPSYYILRLTIRITLSFKCWQVSNTSLPSTWPTAWIKFHQKSWIFVCLWNVNVVFNVVIKKSLKSHRRVY